MLRYVFVLAVLIFTQPAFALEFERTVLDNGMEVIVIPDHRAPVVVNFVWYKVGAADELDGKTGLAHMLEHLMFKGTKNIPPQEFSKIIARNGGKDNAFTSYDYTAYYQKMAKEKLGLAMEMEADRMTGLVFTDKEFVPERDVVAEERRWRIDSKPTNIFYEEMQGKHFERHPYRRPVIGYMKDIQAYTREDNLAWYKRYYSPTGATLMLIGDVTLKEALPMIQKTYGQLPKKETQRADWEIEPNWQKAKRFKKVDGRVKVPIFERYYRSPSCFAGISGQEIQKYEALKLYLLSEILGSGSTSWLYRELVKESKIADSASSVYHGVAKGETTFDLTLQPKEGVSLAKLEEKTNEVIARFIEVGPSEKELQNAKTSFLSSSIFAQDDLFTKGYHLGRWIVSGGTAETYDDWQEDIKSITVLDIQNVAEKYLVLNRSTTGLLVANEEQF